MKKAFQRNRGGRTRIGNGRWHVRMRGAAAAAENHDNVQECAESDRQARENQSV